MAKKVKPGMLRGNTNENKLTADENDYILSIIGGMSYGLNELAQPRSYIFRKQVPAKARVEHGEKNPVSNIV